MLYYLLVYQRCRSGCFFHGSGFFLKLFFWNHIQSGSGFRFSGYLSLFFTNVADPGVFFTDPDFFLKSFFWDHIRSDHGSGLRFRGYFRIPFGSSICFTGLDLKKKNWTRSRPFKGFDPDPDQIDSELINFGQDPINFGPDPINFDPYPINFDPDLINFDQDPINSTRPRVDQCWPRSE